MININPVVIQRSRKIKNISPNGLPIVYVGRPSKYGNPFILYGDIIYGNASHRRKILSPYIYIETINPNKGQQRLVELYRKWVNNEQEVLDMYIIPCPFTITDVKAALQGKNLSCWCALDKPCHRNVLLEIANT